MRRRTFVAAFATGLTASAAGCLGGGSEDTTTTPTQTTTQPAPATTPTETPTQTTEQPQTTTTQTPPDVSATLLRIDPADRVVRDGVATVVASVTNQGGPGEERVTVTLDRQQGDRYTYETDTVLALEANETRTIKLRADFNATGAYDVLVNGTPVGTVDVRSLGHTGYTPPDGDEDTAPVIDVIATGNATAK